MCANSLAKYKTEMRVGVLVLYVLSYLHLQWLFVVQTKSSNVFIRLVYEELAVAMWELDLKGFYDLFGKIYFQNTSFLKLTRGY